MHPSPITGVAPDVGIGKAGKAVKLASKGSQLLLKAGKTHRHHIFPQQFRSWFAKRGITNIDNYTVEIGRSVHLKGVHGKGMGQTLPGGWNSKWAEFIKANPDATASQIFYHAEGLLNRYGLQNLKYIPYK